VFVIDSSTIRNTEEVVHHIRRVVGFVASENSIEPRTGPLGFQRCLLYQDEQGRLFNLMLSKHCIGPAATWLEYLESFSGRLAMIALVVLSRSVPCLLDGQYSMTRDIRMPWSKPFHWTHNTLSCPNLFRTNTSELKTSLPFCYFGFGLHGGNQLVVAQREHDGSRHPLRVGTQPLFAACVRLAAQIVTGCACNSGNNTRIGADHIHGGGYCWILPCSACQSRSTFVALPSMEATPVHWTWKFLDCILTCCRYRLFVSLHGSSLHCDRREGRDGVCAQDCSASCGCLFCFRLQ
jgi:hypothetical protein